MTGHVKFADPEGCHEGQVEVTTDAHGTQTAHIGFLQAYYQSTYTVICHLQNYHEYRMTLSLPLHLHGQIEQSAGGKFNIVVENMKEEGGRERTCGHVSHIGDSTVMEMIIRTEGVKGHIETPFHINNNGERTKIVIAANVLGNGAGADIKYVYTQIRTKGRRI